jgi:hypothetical protein
MPYITINTEASNLVEFQALESGDHLAAFICGASFYQKLTENDNPVPPYKLFETVADGPQASTVLLSLFNNQVLAGTSSGFGGTSSAGFSGGSTLDRELHSMLNYLQYGGRIVAATGATALAITDLPIDSVFCEDRTKFNDVINLVSIRQDCIGILGGSFEYHNGSTGTYPTSIAQLSLNGITGISGATAIDELFFSVVGRKTRSRFYGAGQTGTINILLTSDAAGCMTRVDNNNGPWTAPAGTLNGIITTDFKDFQPKLSEDDIFTLYNTYGSNTIKKIFGSDFLYLWGDATQEGTDLLRMQLGISRLILHIKRIIKPLLESVLFGPNNVTVRRNLTNSIQTLMAEIQRRNGISSFSVVCDESNNTANVIDNRSLVIDLSFKPYQSIETITFRFTVNRD